VQEVTAETLTELYISYNLIEKMKGISALKKLKVRSFIPALLQTGIHLHGAPIEKQEAQLSPRDRAMRRVN